MIRRFTIDEKEPYSFDVIDQLTGEVLETFTHAWRAEKCVNRLTREAYEKGEPTIVFIIKGTDGKILYRSAYKHEI